MSEYFTAAECFGTAYDDNDHDGIGDQCEWALAKRFAPILVTDSSFGDEVGRDPYWAVRRGSTDTTIIIAYFPAYYFDNGCYYGLVCAYDGGHIGDSEAIGVEIQWHGASEHWVVVVAELSQHNGYAGFGGTVYATGLEYPTELGGPFRVHVSWGKHANFETRSACNADGIYGEDYCGNALTSGDTLYVGIERNLGSASYQLHNCVISSIPYDDFQECFWTGEYFLGWNSGPGSTDPYSNRLEHFGFIF